MSLITSATRTLYQRLLREVIRPNKKQREKKEHEKTTDSKKGGKGRRRRKRGQRTKVMTRHVDLIEALNVESDVIARVGDLKWNWLIASYPITV